MHCNIGSFLLILSHSAYLSPPPVDDGVVVRGLVVYEVVLLRNKDFFLSLSLAVGEGIGKPTAAARGSSMYLTGYRVST